MMKPAKALKAGDRLWIYDGLACVTHIRREKTGPVAHMVSVTFKHPTRGDWTTALNAEELISEVPPVFLKLPLKKIVQPAERVIKEQTAPKLKRKR